MVGPDLNHRRWGRSQGVRVPSHGGRWVGRVRSVDHRKDVPSRGDRTSGKCGRGTEKQG